MNRREFVRVSLAAACVVGAGSAFADVPPVPHRPGPAPHHPPKPIPPPPHHPPKPVPPPSMIECPHCHGRGRVRRNWLGFTKECPKCHGHGRIPAPVPPPKPVPPPPKPAPKPGPHGGPAGGPNHGPAGGPNHGPAGAPPPRR